MKAGKDTTSDAAKVMAGGIVEQQIDPFSGMPVKIIVDPASPVISSTDIITIPQGDLDGSSPNGNAEKVVDDKA